MRTCSAVLLSISLVRAASATDAQSRITHEGYEKDLKNFWDHADARFSHIEYNGHLKSEAHLRATWEKEWLGHFPVLDRYSVMEYGIGGGLLGEHLLTTRGASHYVGIDISTRQLEHAAERLARCCNYRYTLLRVNESLSDDLIAPFRPTVFVSQAVIQHFPSEAYVAAFLEVLSRAAVPHLMLQVRDDHVTRRTDVSYGAVTYSQLTSRSFLLSHLPMYCPRWSSIPSPSSGYTFYWLQLRGEGRDSCES